MRTKYIIAKKKTKHKSQSIKNVSSLSNNTLVSTHSNEFCTGCHRKVNTMNITSIAFKGKGVKGINNKMRKTGTCEYGHKWRQSTKQTKLSNNKKQSLMRGGVLNYTISPLPLPTPLPTRTYNNLIFPGRNANNVKAQREILNKIKQYQLDTSKSNIKPIVGSSTPTNQNLLPGGWQRIAFKRRSSSKPLENIYATKPPPPPPRPNRPPPPPPPPPPRPIKH